MTKADFIAGENLRDNTDVSGSEDNTVVTAAVAGTEGEPKASKSGYFDEQALDPYEVANAKD